VGGEEGSLHISFPSSAAWLEKKREEGPPSLCLNLEKRRGGEKGKQRRCPLVVDAEATGKADGGKKKKKKKKKKREKKGKRKGNGKRGPSNRRPAKNTHQEKGGGGEGRKRGKGFLILAGRPERREGKVGAVLRLGDQNAVGKKCSLRAGDDRPPWQSCRAGPGNTIQEGKGREAIAKWGVPHRKKKKKEGKRKSKPGRSNHHAKWRKKLSFLKKKRDGCNRRVLPEPIIANSRAQIRKRKKKGKRGEGGEKKIMGGSFLPAVCPKRRWGRKKRGEGKGKKKGGQDRALLFSLMLPIGSLREKKSGGEKKKKKKRQTKRQARGDRSGRGGKKRRGKKKEGKGGDRSICYRIF